MKITARNAAFQQWQALLTNRTKRHRAGEFLVHGVRPITLAVEYGWPVRTLIYDMSRPLSAWARGILDSATAEQVAMAPDLLRELSEKDEDAPELIAVAAIPADDLSRISAGLIVVADRMSSPGNVGTLVRSADAFGARGLIVTGHAADPYDRNPSAPRPVRCSPSRSFGSLARPRS